MRWSQRTASLVRLFSVTAAGAACREGTAPIAPVTAEIAVDVLTSPAYVRLGTPSRRLAESDPAASVAWDLALTSTEVTANGGDAGPGSVAVYCVCQNARAIAPELVAMTPANQLASFERVGLPDIPPASAFERDSIVPAISGWFAGSPGPAMAPVPTRSWLLRNESAGGLTLGKFHVTGITGATAHAAGVVTFEWAVQQLAGGAFGATRTATVDTRGGPVFFDLDAGMVSTRDQWDVQFSGFQILINGGASGSGMLSAVAITATPFALLTAAQAASVSPLVFHRDKLRGAFSRQPWFRRNITGHDGRVWPTFDVYLVRRGPEVYKIQATGYYGPDGMPGQVTLRSARLR